MHGSVFFILGPDLLGNSRFVAQTTNLYQQLFTCSHGYPNLKGIMHDFFFESSPSTKKLTQGLECHQEVESRDCRFYHELYTRVSWCVFQCFK